MNNVNWNEISKDRNDIECLNCYSGHVHDNLGSRKLNEDFIQSAHSCVDCGGIVIIMNEGYNSPCPICNDGYIRKSDLVNIQNEKLEIRNKIINELIIDLARMSNSNVEWNSVMFLEFLQNHKDK